MRVYSIFLSIDGEVNCFHQGGFATFLRLAGCNLSCDYCDTRYAQDGNGGLGEMSVEKVFASIKKLGCKKVTVTGGEPLLQAEELFALTRLFFYQGYHVSVETNGTLDPRGYVDCWIMDWKLPSSGVSFDRDDETLNRFLSLRRHDFIKFVVADRTDFLTAASIRNELNEQSCRARYVLSPNHDLLDPNVLLAWMKKEKMYDSILNVQLHKYLSLVEDF